MILFVICLSLQAQDRYTLKFDKANYSFSMKDNVLCIDTKESTVFYSKDTTSPAFPYSPFCILRPAGCFSDKYQVEMKKELIYENIDVEATPAVVPTRVVVTDTIHHPATASVNTPIIMGGNMSRGDFRYVYLKAAPFVFDIKSRSLYFISEMTITLPNESSPVKTELPEGVFPEEVSKEEVANMVINPEEMNKFYPKSSSSKIKKRMTTYSDPVDYVIITSNALANSFKDLASWKIKKGLHTKIVTVEQIYQTTSGNTNVLKIKKYLQQLYQNNGLKWVLLGGDTSIVPSLMCKIIAINAFDEEYETETPTDLFYACFGGRFDWDQNQNGVYGEYNDGISMYPNIYVSRVPSRNNTDVANFTAKLLAYETQPTPSANLEKILLVAKDYEYEGNGKSKYQKSSERLYHDYIANNTNYHVDYMYDNESNMSYYPKARADYLSSLINQNYHFVNYEGHGGNSCLTFSWDEPRLYDNSFIANQTNTLPTIFTTTSCDGNSFDVINCLSALLLNGVHGGVAYLGSSRTGYSYPNVVSYNALINGYFYQYIFNHGNLFTAHNRFGEAAALAKKDIINEATSGDNIYRRIMFSTNPMGDPEMAIHNMIPHPLSEFPVSTNASTVTVSPGFGSECTIAVTSADDGVSYFSKVKDVSHTFEGVPSPYYVTVSKEGFLPYAYGPLYNAESILGNSAVQNTETYTLDKDVPNGFSLSWSIEGYPSGVYCYQGSLPNQCIVWNRNSNQMDVYLKATLSKDLLFSSSTKKKITLIPSNSRNSNGSKSLSVINSNRAIHVSAGNNCMETETWNLEISNAQTGVSVYKTHVTGKECTINTEGWKPGVYIIRKETGDDIQISKIAIR